MEGQVVLVTGSAQGLGKAICRMLNEEGVSVVIADIREELVQTLVGELSHNGNKSQPLILDVSDEIQVEKEIAGIVSRYGRLDIRVNNAAMDKMVSVEELSVAGGMRTPFLLDRFTDIDQSTLQDPRNVAVTVRFI